MPATTWANDILARDLTKNVIERLETVAKAIETIPDVGERDAIANVLSAGLDVSSAIASLRSYLQTLTDEEDA